MGLTDKIKDWDEIHKLIEMLKLSRGEEQREYVIKVSNLTQQYSKKHGVKYNLLQRPT